jgi:Membrane proteins related to metalloendopeptidases
MLLIRFFIFSILFLSTLNDVPKDKSIFIPPVKIPQLLSANFGDLRIDHFHSGIDIKTQRVTGKEVVASANGYIYRISITPGGFGNALYIRHPSGYSTVYGHLERFVPDIENYVKAQQYEKKSFQITLFPAKDQFPVKQGELIAYSGNSGSSGGPHLHFEIRKSDGEKPINPLLFDFGMVDNIKPVIEKLVIYPINRLTLINNQNSIKKINVTGGHGVYTVPQENEISINGLAGFGIKAYDMLNDSPNKCAVYSIELLIDSTSVFKYIMDSFSFDESRYVNSHIDYETYMRENTYIERVFVLPDDKLSAYKNVINRGLCNFNDDKLHLAEIIVYDANNNKSVLTFHIKGKLKKSQPVAGLTDKNIKIMPYNKVNKFSSENISINIPEGALYDTLYFSYKKEKGTNEMFSDLHYVDDKFTPVQKAYSLSIKPAYIPAGKESKMLLVQLGDDQKRSGIKSTWAEGYLSADLLSFGRFYVGIDTIAPIISANGFVSGANLTGKKEIRIKITDELSGIKSYEPSIDGKWALFEYDQKNDMLIYKFDETRITKGSKHNLSLKVTDNKDNFSVYKCNFIW